MGISVSQSHTVALMLQKKQGNANNIQNTTPISKKAVIPANSRSKLLLRESKQEQRVITPMSNVVLPSQSFEEEINNLVFTEEDQRMVHQSRRAAYSKKSQKNDQLLIKPSSQQVEKKISSSSVRGKKVHINKKK